MTNSICNYSLKPKSYLAGTKLEQFRNLKDVCKEASPLCNVLIGDSFIAQMEWRHTKLAKTYFKDWVLLGIGGDKVEHLLWRIMNGGLPKQPAKTIISIVTNNVKRNNIKSICDTILDIARIIKSRGSEVFICEQFPRENIATSNLIRKLNNALQNICQKNGIFFIGNNPIFWKNSSCNEKLFDQDKIHLKSYGYEMFCRNIVFNSISKKSTSIDDENIQISKAKLSKNYESDFPSLPIKVSNYGPTSIKSYSKNTFQLNPSEFPSLQKHNSVPIRPLINSINTTSVPNKSSTVHYTFQNHITIPKPPVSSKCFPCCNVNKVVQSNNLNTNCSRTSISQACSRKHINISSIEFKNVRKVSSPSYQFINVCIVPTKSRISSCKTVISVMPSKYICNSNVNPSFNVYTQTVHNLPPPFHSISNEDRIGEEKIFEKKKIHEPSSLDEGLKSMIHQLTDMKLLFLYFLTLLFSFNSAFRECLRNLFICSWRKMFVHLLLMFSVTFDVLYFKIYENFIYKLFIFVELLFHIIFCFLGGMYYIFTYSKYVQWRHFFLRVFTSL